jgi:hypothetical protein
VIEQDEARKEMGGEAEVVQHRQDRRAVALVQSDQQVHGRDLVAKVEVDRRLVEQKDGRRLGDRHGDQHQLPLAQGQLPGIASDERLDADTRDGRIDRGAIGRSCATERVLVRDPAERHDLLHAGREREGGRLRDHAESSRDGQPVERSDARAEQLDRPGRGGERAGHEAQQGRLSCAITADQGDPLARGDAQVDAGQCLPIAVSHIDSDQLDRRSPARAPLPAHNS